ncbi:hypothetical protein [Geminisphaera colitermitum]|uniref:hypothetical protein n=1 Tax=Geminisphaera colitermitum TaxID=1148786 RepID=UPI0001964E5B|nr:hypothetical protein [Geminisphaera colitermitum]
MKYNEVEEMCRVTLTSDDLVKIGENAGDNGLKKTQLGSELERIKKDYKNRIEALAAEIELDHEKLRTKYEMRKTLCFWTYDTPKKGRKTLRRVDTGEVIRDEVMDGNDTQHVMATIDAEAATQAVAKAVTGDAGALPQLPADIAPPTGSAPGVKSKKFREHYTSEAFSTARCYEFASWLHRVFSVTGDLISEMVEEIIAKPETNRAEFLQWLEELPRPGSRVLARELRERGIKTLAETVSVPAPEKPAPAAELPLEPWPEVGDAVLGSAIFDAETSGKFAEYLREIYYPFGTLDPSPENIEAGIDDLSGIGDILSLFLQWIEEAPRPGGKAVSDALRKTGVVPPAVQTSADEKPSKPRRASRNGVVGCDADGDGLSDPEDNKNGQ